MDIVNTYTTDLITWPFSYTENAHYAWLTNDLSPDERFPVIDGYAMMGIDGLIPIINDDEPMCQWLLRCCRTQLPISSGHRCMVMPILTMSYQRNMDCCE